MAIRGKLLLLTALLVLMLVALTPAFAGDKEAMGDAWWTGPLQTPNAGTLPKDHWYVETYFAVEQDNGGWDNGGHRYGANNKVLGSGYDNDYQSTTLFSYGVMKNFTTQVLLGVDGAQGGTGTPSSNGLEVNTVRLREVVKLHSYKQGQPWPTFSIVPEVNAPVAAGSVWTPGIGFWAIRPFWMPGGRILRIRASEDIFFPRGGKEVSNLNTFKSSTGLANTPTTALSATCLANSNCSLDAAKYGVTQVGLEYSLTKHWVPAFDFVWKYYGENKYNGSDAIGITGVTAAGLPTTGVFQGRRDFRVDPALEYNFTENTGIIFGAEVTVTGRNTGSYIAPQIALQWFK